MSFFRKKPIIIEAIQWFKNGDHPEDGTERFTHGEYVGELYEGKVVRYFRRPDIPGTSRCVSSIPCAYTMHEHGWIDTPEGGHTVCPGDWIITGVRGEQYPIKDEIFRVTYELVGGDAPAS